MARYFFHLHEHTTILSDGEGQDCASLEEAMQVAIVAARDVMMGEVRLGRLDLGWYISIVDGAAEEVGRVAFQDAVMIARI